MNQPKLQNESTPLAEKLAWLCLVRADNVGPITFFRLVNTYGSATEVLEILPELSKRGGRKKPLTPPKENFHTPPANDADIPQNAQETILEHLSFHPVAVDELIRTCQWSIPIVQTILLELELAGRIKRLPGGRVSLVQEG